MATGASGVRARSTHLQQIAPSRATPTTTTSYEEAHKTIDAFFNEYPKLQEKLQALAASASAKQNLGRVSQEIDKAIQRRKKEAGILLNKQVNVASRMMRSFLMEAGRNGVDIYTRQQTVQRLTNYMCEWSQIADCLHLNRVPRDGWAYILLPFANRARAGGDSSMLRTVMCVCKRWREACQQELRPHLENLQCLQTLRNTYPDKFSTITLHDMKITDMNAPFFNSKKLRELVARLIPCLQRDERLVFMTIPPNKSVSQIITPLQKSPGRMVVENRDAASSHILNHLSANQWTTEPYHALFAFSILDILKDSMTGSEQTAELAKFGCTSPTIYETALAISLMDAVHGVQLVAPSRPEDNQTTIELRTSTQAVDAAQPPKSLKFWSYVQMNERAFFWEPGLFCPKPNETKIQLSIELCDDVPQTDLLTALCWRDPPIELQNNTLHMDTTRPGGSITARLDLR